MQPSLTDQIEGELNKRWKEPRCATLRSLYEERREVLQRNDARITARIAGILYVLFAATDLVLISDVALYSIVSRFVIGFLFVFVINHQINHRVKLSIIDRQSAAGIIAAYAMWITISSQSMYHINVSYYITFGIIFMMMQNIFFNLRFSVAASASTVLLFSFLIYMFFLFDKTFEYTVAIGTLYIAAYILTLLVNWKLNEERYRVFLNSLHAEIRQKQSVEHGEALQRLSTTDALTGISNRRAIDDELRQLWESRQSIGKNFAVILIDIDYFKKYNDHYGHQAGDQCLIFVANAMEFVASRHQSTLGRFGGEEFIVLLRAQTADNLLAVAEDFRNAVESLQINHEQRPDKSFVVTVSIGAAFSQDVTGTKVERLIMEADRALYDAKRASRNCVRIFDANDPERLDLNESVADLLRTAIDHDRLSMVYQPIRDSRTGAIVAAETLMRLTAPNGKPISPALFIPIAEQSGYIVELGKWAIRRACQELIATDLVPSVSVNVSAVQLEEPTFALSVASILAECGVSPHRLAVEVTEGLQIDGQEAIQKSLSELRQLGVRIWLDDFGTGFAGLSCLRETEFDAVKIDRSFLHASHTLKGAAMFRNIVGLLKNNGCVTVAEGIQTEDHRLLSSELQIDMLQGFHLGLPMSADALRKFSQDGLGISTMQHAAQVLIAAGGGEVPVMPVTKWERPSLNP